MKKILATLVLVTFAFAANAQLFVSANIGGAMKSGNTHTTTHVTIVTDSTVATDVPLDETKTFTGGLRIGYKFGRIQAGIAGSYTMGTTVFQTVDHSLMPIPTQDGYSFEGTTTTKVTSFMVAPFIRYDIIQAGDVSLFAELHAFYSMQNDPEQEIHLAIKKGQETFISTDTNFISELHTTALGVQVIPGLSWQLSKHCSLDLYFDFLSLAYASSTTESTTHNYSFKFSGVSDYAITDESTSMTVKSSSFEGGLHGSPLLTQLGSSNWVRVGFNFTF